MDNGKAFAVLVFIIAIFALYLQSKYQLMPVITVLESPGDAVNSRPWYDYVIALTAFLVVTPFLPGEWGTVLAGLILTDALLTNTKSGHNVIKDILNP